MDTLQPFITGIPESSLKIPKEVGDFNLDFSKTFNLGDGNTATTGSETLIFQESSREAYITKINVSWTSSQSGAGSYSANINVTVRGEVIFVYSRDFTLSKETDYFTVDLVNPIFINQNEQVEFNFVVNNKTPAYGNDVQFVNNISLKGINQP